MRYFLFLIIFFSTSVFAQDYYWTIIHAYSSSQVGLTSPSPSALCGSAYTAYAASGLYYADNQSMHKSSDTVFVCRGVGKVTSDNRQITADPFTFATLHRSGDSCPEGTTYNSQTGECEQPDQCSQTEGRMVAHLFLANTRTNPYDPWPSGPVESPYSVCSNSCRYSASGTGDLTCGTLTSGTPLEQYCIRPFLGTGTECQEGDSDHFAGPGVDTGPSPDPGDGGDGPSPDPDDEYDPTDPQQLCNNTPGFQWAGSTCVSIFDHPSNPNDNGGGSSGGSGGNGDGGDGTGDGGDGTGDGGDGSPGGGVPTDPSDPVLNVMCDQDYQCEGDSYNCAILYHTRKTACQFESYYDFEDQQDNINSLFEGDDFQLPDFDDPENIIDLSGGGGIGFSTGSRWLSSGCPADISIPLSGRTYTLSMQPYCAFADGIGYLIVIAATIFFAVYVGRSS